MIQEIDSARSLLFKMKVSSGKLQEWKSLLLVPAHFAPRPYCIDYLLLFINYRTFFIDYLLFFIEIVYFESFNTKETWSKGRGEYWQSRGREFDRKNHRKFPVITENFGWLRKTSVPEKFLDHIHCKDKIPKFRNKYSQKRNIGVSVPISTFMRLWAIYIVPQTVPYSAGGNM